MALTYVTGDATYPQGDGRKLIVHVCNDQGLWGAGFVLALSKRWPEPERRYLSLNTHRLGALQMIEVQPDITVVNMIAQEGFYRPGGPPAIRYDKLQQCLKDLCRYADVLNASVHMPRIGCGLAGGSWDEVEPIVKDTLVAHGVPVTVYDLP